MRRERLAQLQTPPNLDERCGRHFTYRDLIACGETWQRLAQAPPRDGPVDNRPRIPATYAAMRAMCLAVLDPVVDRFGKVLLTYGFASRVLTKHIRADIAPRLDQHAGHELNSRGFPTCPRLGLAVDFEVPGVDGWVLGRWVVENTPFDRLYFYGATSPIHVSVGPENARQIVVLRTSPSGRRIPKVVGADFFTVVPHDAAQR